MSNYPALRQIDVHTHAMPLPFLEWLEGQGLADLSHLDDGYVLAAPEITGLEADTPIECPPSAYDVETRLAYMDGSGVEVQVVALASTLRAAVSEDWDLVHEVTVRSNEELARFVAQAPDRLVALATANAGMDGCVDEVRRCLVDLGMAGVALGTHSGGRELADPRHEPLWELLAEHRTFTLLHPVAGPGGYGEKGVPWPGSVAAGVDLALATSGLIHAGVLERHDFPLCVVYGGGALPGLRGMMQRGADALDEWSGLTISPMEQVRRLYFDTTTFDTLLLKQLVEFVGPAHVLMGSDFPARTGDADPIGVVEACQFGPMQEMITGVNAMNLLRLPQ